MKVLKVIGQVILYVFIGIIIFIVGYNFVSKVILQQKMTVLCGYTSAIVVSGSMEPTINIDDYVLIHQQADYEVGNIICFVDDDGMVVTHRVSRIEEVDGVENFYTKGDANDSEDLDPKILDQIYGQVIWSLAGVGSVVSFFQSIWGIIILLSAIGLLFFIVLYIKSIKEEKAQSLRDIEATDKQGDNKAMKIHHKGIKKLPQTLNGETADRMESKVDSNDNAENKAQDNTENKDKTENKVDSKDEAEKKVKSKTKTEVKSKTEKTKERTKKELQPKEKTKKEMTFKNKTE